MVSYYQVLGVNEDSSQDKIRQAYRDRMKAHHTDRHGQSDDPIVRLIAEAYRVLGNPAEREQYNKRLHGNRGSSSAVVKAHQSSTGTPPPQTATWTREVCGRCDGRGYNPTLGVKWPCHYCGGKGWVPGKIAL
jgi:curved DNA-binding protein CbpA